MFALEVVITARKDNLKCFAVQYLSKLLLNWYLWKTAWSICSSHFFSSLGLNSGYASELPVALKKKKKTKQAPGLQGCSAFLRAQCSGWKDSDIQEPGSESRILSSASWGRPTPHWAVHLPCAGSCWNCSSWPKPGAMPLPAFRNLLCLWAHTKSSWRTQGRKFSRGLVTMIVVLFAYTH